MAAQPNRAGFLGIAWGATYRVFTVPIGAHIPGDDPLRNAFEWDAAYRSVLASGVDIVNASYSTGGTFIENFTPDRLRNSASFGPEFDVIAQRGVPDPAIFVWPAGNDHGDPCDEGERNCFADDLSSTGFSYRATSPNLGGGAVARLPELQGHNVVVVAVDQGGGIADFSNRCGIAGDYCLAAPGTDGPRSVNTATASPQFSHEPTTPRDRRTDSTYRSFIGPRPFHRSNTACQLISPSSKSHRLASGSYSHGNG